MIKFAVLGSSAAALAVVLSGAGCSHSETGFIEPNGAGGSFPGGSDGGIGCPGNGVSNGATPDGTGGGGPGSLSSAPPQYGATVTREVAPAPISGGTLLVLRDGHTAVAADPDRDRVFVVDLTGKTVKANIALGSNDEPGRAVEDATGRVHVALRRGGAVVTLQPPAFTVSDRQAVCAAPRGLAYDAKADRIHVACAGGELVTLAAAGGPPVRTVQLDRDLRDVVVDGDRLLVSRFRSAQILTLDADGRVTQRLTPPVFRSPEARFNQLFSPAVAWRMVAMPGGGVAMAHQRGLVDEVQPTFGGYGSNNPCDSIVQSAVLVMNGTTMPKSVPAIPGMTLPVDIAISPNGKRVALLAAGNATNAQVPGGPPQLAQVFAADVSDVSNPAIGCRPDGTFGPCNGDDGFGGSGTGGATGTGGTGGGAADAGVAPPMSGAAGGGASSDPTGATAPAPGPGAPFPPPPLCPTVPSHPGELPAPGSEPIALAYDGDAKVVVQTREPAALRLASGAIISLSTESREDTGHTIFHSNAGGSMACASCHPEGAEDGRTWNFACEGERRTQSLAAGISGTEPFHWNGDMTSFPSLMQNVFTMRMSGPKLSSDQMTAALHWIDHQPRVPVRAPADAASVERGRVLFNDTRVACGTCHTGAHFTNNKDADVGTGTKFQIPSLLGIGARAPFMHNGCANTLADRFTNPACGGGDKHGVTSHLSSAQIADLSNYLETL